MLRDGVSYLVTCGSSSSDSREVSLKVSQVYPFISRGVAGPERWMSVNVLAVTVFKTNLGCFHFHCERDVAIRLLFSKQYKSWHQDRMRLSSSRMKTLCSKVQPGY
jgi:hypothetical protein